MKILLGPLLLLALCYNSMAQSARQVTTRSSFSVQLDQNTVVLDSTGAQLPYRTFAPMIASGTYTLDAMRDASGKVTGYRIRPKRADDASKRQMSMQTPGAENKPKVGATLPSFTLVSTDNKVVSSEDLKGKIIVLNFWFSVCRPCLAEIPGINKLADSYKDNKDIVFIACDWEKRDAVKKFLETQHLSYTPVPEANSLIDELKIKAYPTHLIVGRDGKILNSYSGGLPGIEDVLKHDIEAALKM